MPARPSHKAPGRAGTDGLRADARHNRDRILKAAREAFAVHGIDVPLTAIARRAGVGVATLYRRFPTRESLLTEAFKEELTVCMSVLDEALLDPDPWRGFCTVIEKVCLMQAADRGFTAAFLSRFPGDPDFERQRAHAEKALAELVRRAKDTGRLRDDFDPRDIPLLLLANSGVIGQSREISTTASRRLVAYLLQSFQADHTAPLPPPAPLALRPIK